MRFIIGLVKIPIYLPQEIKLIFSSHHPQSGVYAISMNDSFCRQLFLCEAWMYLLCIAVPYGWDHVEG